MVSRSYACYRCAHAIYPRKYWSLVMKRCYCTRALVGYSDERGCIRTKESSQDPECRLLPSPGIATKIVAIRRLPATQWLYRSNHHRHGQNSLHMVVVVWNSRGYLWIDRSLSWWIVFGPSPPDGSHQPWSWVVLHHHLSPPKSIIEHPPTIKRKFRIHKPLPRIHHSTMKFPTQFTMKFTSKPLTNHSFTSAGADLLLVRRPICWALNCCFTSPRLPQQFMDSQVGAQRLVNGWSLAAHSGEVDHQIAIIIVVYSG